jgi:hypothetical protein
MMARWPDPSKTHRESARPSFQHQTVTERRASDAANFDATISQLS